mmetsp:Transcript_76767/g.225390  ORF Transcript_76767/g.225390 Transcript_76767/m.225390 type:complete len:210 (+) Transcript_76767:86-715(+)
MPPNPAEDNFSLGVTQLLDELLAKRDQEDVVRTAAPDGKEEQDSTSSAPQGEIDDGALSQTFQRTANLCGEVEARLAASTAGPEGQERAEAVLRELRAERGLGFRETLGSTGGSLTAALRANDLRLQRLRSELEELKQHCAGVLGPEEPTLEQSQQLPSAANTAELAELEQLLSECDLARAEVGGWKGLDQTPPGWRRLQPGELGGGGD